MLEIISFSTVLQSMGLQKVGHSLAMEQQQIKIWDFFFFESCHLYYEHSFMLECIR